MHDRQHVETILARLMPPALSDEGQRGIEAMLDGLAGTSSAPRMHRSYLRPIIAGGLAASLVASLVILRLANPGMPAARADHVTPDFLLVSQSDRIESMVDEGWRETPDGTPMRALRMRVVEEDSIFDEETGMVMQVSEPREELLLMPVSTF